ncbi:hypothetical protein VNO78_04627 [Psophocarpus tetragonolobus]|uniref:Uncharacterized protein n=1 Tax=Psophocarpus tetragonolobus TaxID=3891 RepID=A0AAN9T5Z2_PSOTE
MFSTPYQSLINDFLTPQARGSPGTPLRRDCFLLLFLPNQSWGHTLAHRILYRERNKRERVYVETSPCYVNGG